VGIWCWNSQDVVIQHCESFENVTPGTQDGGGFDIDWSCSRSVIQHCYSHDNEGAGFLFMGAGEAGLTTGSIVRFNISQNDGLKNNYGGILCYGNLRDSSVHNNAVFVRGHAGGAAIQFRGDAKAGFPSGVEVVNNIAIVEGGREHLRVPAQAAGANRFDSNCYFAPTGFQAAWGDTIFDDLESFRAATGQERQGLFAEARLRAPGRAARGRLPLDEYRPLPDSPCLGAGAAVPRSEGALDYWGARLAPGSRPSIGPFHAAAPP